jgi:hypothetical protein
MIKISLLFLPGYGNLVKSVLLTTIRTTKGMKKLTGFEPLFTRCYNPVYILRNIYHKHTIEKEQLKMLCWPACTELCIQYRIVTCTFLFSLCTEPTENRQKSIFYKFLQ